MEQSFGLKQASAGPEPATLGTTYWALPTRHALLAPASTPTCYPTPGRKSFPFIFTADCVLMAVSFGQWIGWGLKQRQQKEATSTAAELIQQPQEVVILCNFSYFCAYRLAHTLPCLQGVYAWKGLIPGIGGSDSQQQS